MPHRRCVGCGRSRPRAELLRFVAEGDTLARDPEGRRAGRGAYLCRDAGAAPDEFAPAPECARRALERRGFQRTLRLAVRVESDLIDLKTGS